LLFNRALGRSVVDDGMAAAVPRDCARKDRANCAWGYRNIVSSITIDIGCKTGIDIEVTPLGGGLYRLDDEPALFLCADDDEDADSYPRYGDIMRLALNHDGILCYEGVETRGPFKHYEIGIPKGLYASERFLTNLKSITAHGGYWEIHMRGILLLSIPDDSTWDPFDALAKFIQAEMP